MELSLISIVLCLLIVQIVNLFAEVNKRTDQLFICPLNFFHCDTQRCLPNALICNGEYNCHDKTDEINCSFALINNHQCQTASSISCEQDILHSTFHTDHQIHDADIHPIEICIKRSAVCDGVIDCRNGIDEDCLRQNPLITCSTNEYYCQITHRCIPNIWKCNGINDCLDPFASDELDCPMKFVNCLTNEFRCQSKDQCIPLMAVCDGIEDCADKSDEFPSQCSNSTRAVCTRDQFECKSSKLCISKSNQCDTITQCHDRTDEIFCPCPTDDYLTQKLFYRCDSINRCLPKDLQCDVKRRQCNPTYLNDEEEENDDQSCSLFMYRPCLNNGTCLGENQYCQEYFPRKYCVCQNGYRINETTGICEDINECRERVVCDHYCINTNGSYRCACRENYHLKSDKHTCTHRNENFAWFYGLFDNGIHRMVINKENELTISDSWIYPLDNHAYLIDYDPIMDDLYYAECAIPIRPILMSCAKTLGIFRIHLNQSKLFKELIIDGHAYPSIQSMAIDWLHRNIYFVNMHLQTIEVCRLNGSFCRTLLYQTISDYFPQRILLYPEKGFLFYTAVVKSRVQYIIRLGMDGTNLKLLFTSTIMHDVDNVNYLRPLLTIDRINHYLYFYNGLDKIYILNMHGDILHIQYQINHQFHTFKVFADKIYKAFLNKSKFLIHPKYALGTTLQNSLDNIYYLQYPLEIIDFIIVDSNEIARDYPIVNDQCEHLSFPSTINQTEIVCQCSEYYSLADDGYSCLTRCPEHFFHCTLSKKCLPFYQLCDGITDCIFGEDEKNCSSVSCTSPSLFHCSSSSKCLTQTDLCNNVSDCSQGEDEDHLICEHLSEWANKKKYSNICSTIEFFCDGKCVSISHRCDNKPYCYDGADEPLNCINITCPNDYFKCPRSGKCIPNEKICDHFEDCPDLDRINGITADETLDVCNLNVVSNPITSTIATHITCESADLFRCKTTNFCINRTYVCDGDLDCVDSSDEEKCEENHHDLISLSWHKDDTCMNGYRCTHGSLCIPLNELCDGINQCPLGDDEHPWRCRNCSDCHSPSSYCELINRRPICQCQKGYAKIANGSCIYEDNLCHWSYGVCSQAKLTTINNEGDFCIRKNSYISCQCDRGYDMIKENDNNIACVVKTNRTFEVMLNPRASFYLSLHGSIVAPIHSSHHVIDAVFIHVNHAWYILYTEQRNGHAFIWKENFNETNQLFANNAIQIWSSSLFQFTLLKVDWIHRLIYALYHDLSGSSNGIEILYANNDDYTQLTFVNRMTFSNRKTISSIQVHPLQGYLYISAYYDAQHSYVYRSLLDGSNLKLFLTLDYPTLSMTLDYRHPRLYVLLSNGEIESYSIDASQPWKSNIYHFQNVRPYAMDLHDDTLSVMVFNTTKSIYDEIELNKFGKSIIEKHRQLETPMFVRYIHEFTYPTFDQSNICLAGFCPTDRICIGTPLNRPLCIIPGQMHLCGSSCHSRGICSNGECVCSNQTYVGNDCEMCRLTNSIHVGCFHSSCTCYLSRSQSRQTPYLCTTFKHDRGEIEVPCDRIVTSIERIDCSRTIFLEPSCESPVYSLIYDVPTQSCICRETMNRRIGCLNNGLLISDGTTNSSLCQCFFPFFGQQCELNRCQGYCQNNGTCLFDGTELICKCPNGFTGRQCENNRCRLMQCQHGKSCFLEQNQPICRCDVGQSCHERKGLKWYSWIIILMVGFVLSIGGYTLLRYNLKRFRVKHLFAHRRLHEHIGLEVSVTNTVYSHLPTSDMHCHDRPLEDVLFDENQLITSDMHRSEEERIEDPFYVDEKQPIFTNERYGNHFVMHREI